MTRYSIQCRGLALGYEPGHPVIRVPELTLPFGEISVFCGGNGTGKTTLMKGLAGLLTPWEGTVTCRDETGWSLTFREMLRNSLYVHQEPYILKGTVHQNLALFLSGMNRHEREERISGALALTGLLGFEKKRAASLSGGEKKRLALARAMAAGKNILMLDEPTANVDAQNTSLLMENLANFRQAGMTIVIATHDKEFAAGTADVIYNFADGCLVRQPRTLSEGEANC